ncbi:MULTISPECIES: ATP-binding protein [unclassified Bacillus (in: firmicutes)]|uniref:ATP-binding protein n=1 Tax=unclassified Bacillus (in: firmicutes) TaxID=185979 RepID=UPI0008E46D02|nr:MULTISPECIES: ATP-binding protein [unclassified Bacillus (in: firmicutes)]SFB02098.1 PAS domain S-box-containing protein [Bacillus sp. UNCCL13]SFQ89156.1 PAS domain S-box-containing protein [Bacillus sp. cl95]
MIKTVVEYIYSSHQRCLKEYKMLPDHFTGPKVCINKSILEERKNRLGDLVSVARKFMTKLISELKDTPVLIVITDHEGYILEMYGDEIVKRQVESLGLSLGVKLKEEEVGTNSIAIALELEQPVLISGADHYHHCLHQSACFSVPFYYSGQMSGTISVMMTAQDASSFHVGLLQSAVDSIEREVGVKKQNKELLILNQVLMENSRNGIIITNEDGMIIEVNPFAEKVLAFKKEDILNSPITSVNIIGTYMINSLRGNRKYEDIEINISDKIFLFDAFPIYNKSNQILGAFGQFRDITDRLRLEKQVMASEKLSAIGKISAGLAHEIRNPLTSIMGLLKLVKRNSKANNQKQEEYFRIIFSELERIKNLVQQFVLMAKPDQSGISKAHTSINELIKDIVTLMESQISNKDIQIEYDLSYQCEANIDRDKIKQVLINILQNAFDAMHCNGQIFISVHPSEMDNGIEIIIEDNGMGMDKSTIENLTTPFFSTKENGLGLGLPMSFDIIESHKGRIKVESEKGKGSTFTIWLPK